MCVCGDQRESGGCVWWVPWLHSWLLTATLILKDSLLWSDRKNDHCLSQYSSLSLSLPLCLSLIISPVLSLTPTHKHISPVSTSMPCKAHNLEFKTSGYKEKSFSYSEKEIPTQEGVLNSKFGIQ